MKNPKVIIIQEGKSVEEVFLGIVAPGETKKTIIELKNIGDVDIYDLDIKSEHKDVTLTHEKNSLAIGASMEISLSYTPKIQIDEGIHASIDISMSYVV